MLSKFGAALLIGGLVCLGYSWLVYDTGIDRKTVMAEIFDNQPGTAAIRAQGYARSAAKKEARFNAMLGGGFASVVGACLLGIGSRGKS